MKKAAKFTLTVVAFLLILLLILTHYNSENNKRVEFKALGEQTIQFAETTKERVSNAVITLPDGSEIVGLKDGNGSYKISADESGSVALEMELLTTNFISGIYGVRNPRLDAIVPMRIRGDSKGGSTYIILFNDRGDGAIEKSYARIGDISVPIQNIRTIAPAASEDYKVDITYTTGLTSREVIIPVIDGHFSPENTITK